ncbi:MAG: SLBB domain-containing protein [Bacteroidales bacterium]|nr:SLBB domain-containing protein [Bacteroidales bacterium]
MSRLLKWVLPALCFTMSVTSAIAQSQMTDDQIMSYVEQGIALGKDKSTLMDELTTRGVTKTQAIKVFSLYQGRNPADVTPSQNQVIIEPGRAHTVNGDEKLEDKGVTFEYNDTSMVYGRNIFRNKNLNFAPSENLATPRNYRLGPGDEVIIDVFGRNQTTIRSVISPEGSINVDVLGPLYLSGMTIEEANDYLKKRLAKIYSGLNTRSDTDMRLSLGQIRSIQVNVVGDVAQAGTYRLSSFSTAMHALYCAGGVVDPGTVRSIKVVRGDKVAGVIDVYDFLQRGSLESDIMLEEGDVVLVSPFVNMVKVEGAVKRAMHFELKPGETMSDLIEFAGGFSHSANTSAVTVYRQNDRDFEIRTVDSSDFASFVLQNGDRVTVGDLQSRFSNRVSIHGAVFFPGTYELDVVKTVKGLVEKAGGTLPESFTGRVVIHREYPDMTREVVSVNLASIIEGKAEDFVLKNNDEIYISDSQDLIARSTVSISGMVNNPGTYPFSMNTTIEDLIIIAGGLRPGASTSRVDVTRRKKDADGLHATSEIGHMYTFSLKDGLVENGDRHFVLEPYDEVVVRQSPSYNVQRHFTVNGEVNFPGVYPLTSREERVSDLIRKAGGLTDFAYAPGARLIRTSTEEERRVAKEMVEIIQGEENIDESQKDLEATTNLTFSVSIDLEKALLQPGGDADVVLREGDVLEIPVRSNVVRINGAVKFQTAVNYDSSFRAKDYIEAAGGYSHNANRSNAYVVYMGGRAKRLRPNTKIYPGSEIYVPEKVKGEKKEFNYAALMSVSSSAASLGALIVTLLSSLKK